jgi:hypothetical protein
MRSRYRYVPLLTTAQLLLASSFGTAVPSQEKAKEECERLMTALVPFAQEMLTKHREFHPFGGVVSADGKIERSMSTTGVERPTSQALIDLLEQGFRDGAKRGLYKATAIVVDVRTVPPGKREKQDAVEVRLDHVSGYSIKVLFPYRISPTGEVTIEAPFAVAGEKRIFSQR